MKPESVHQAASRLAANSKIAARIQELRNTVTAAALADRAWDRLRLIAEADVNMLGARQDHQWAAANGALATIGKATGLLDAQQPDTGVQVTKITVILNTGSQDPETEQRVIDGQGAVVEERRELGHPGSD
jgi:hypothetical protein